MKKILILVAVVIVVVGLVSVSAYRYATSPARVLPAISKALKKNDLKAFQKYVDATSVITEWVGNQLDTKASGTDNQQFLETLKSIIVQGLTNAVYGYVSGAEVDAAAADKAPQSAADGMGQNYTLQELSDRGIFFTSAGFARVDGGEIVFEGVRVAKRKGTTALLDVKFSEKAAAEEKALTLAVAMEKREGKWVIVGMPNLFEFLETINRAPDAAGS